MRRRQGGRERRKSPVPVLAVLAVVVVVVVVAGAVYTVATGRAAPMKVSLWDASAAPTGIVANDGKPITVGTRLRTTEAGWISAVHVYNGRAEPASRTVSVRRTDGELLAEVPVPASTGPGWQEVLLPTRINLAAGQGVVVACTTPSGWYFVGVNQLQPASPLVRTPLVGEEGVFVYGPGKPTESWKGSAYYVDVSFVPRASLGQTLRALWRPAPVPGRATPTLTPTVRPSPPTSPRSTLAPVAGTDCAARPSACGYPDGSTTGPASNTRLVRVPAEVTKGEGWEWDPRVGRIRLTVPGVELAGLDVDGGVLIDLPDITVRDSVFSVCGGENDADIISVRVRPDEGYHGVNAKVLRNRMAGNPPGCTHRARSGVRDVYGLATGLLIEGNDISGTGNGITTEREAVVRGNWIHGLAHAPGDHLSGISTHGGGDQLTWINNTVLLADTVIRGAGGVSGALTIYSDGGHAQNVLAEGNFLSGGSYAVYGGNSGDRYTTPSTSIRFRNNRFVCGSWVYGPVAAYEQTSPGNEWTGNFCDRTLEPVT